MTATALVGRARRGAMRRTVVSVVALPLLGLAAAAAGPPPPTSPFIPPVGQQPGTAAPSCTFARLGSTEIRTLYGQQDDHSSSPAQPASTFAVDPRSPCHIFRSLRTGVDRSDDAGRSFSPVFRDNSGSYALSRGATVFSPVVPAPPGGGPIFFYDQSGNNGVYHSPDLGHSWDQRDGGLYAASATGPTGPTGGILAFAVAPSNPAVIYLVGSAGGQTLLYTTSDGGVTWQVGGPPPNPQATALSVDPRDPRHVILAAGGPSTLSGSSGAGPNLFYESSDGGTTWGVRNGPANEAAPIEVDITVGGDGTRLYARTGHVNSSTVPFVIDGQRLWRSIDDGATWQKVSAPAALGLSTTLAFDPSNPNPMLLAAAARDVRGNPGIVLVGSFDGFRSTRYVRFLRMPGEVTALEARADRAGDFFVQVTYSGFDALLALRLTALAQPQASAESGPGGPNFETPLRECSLAPLPSGAPAGLGQAPVYDAGSLAFDGQYLDYAQDELAPGVIFRVRASDCSVAPSITLQPADTGGRAEALYALTFDSGYVFAGGHIGAILVRGSAAGADHDPRVPSGYAAVYAVDPTAGVTELVGAVYCKAAAGNDPSCAQHDPSVFSYDPYLNQLWAPVDVPGTGVDPGRVAMAARSAAPLRAVPTCMTGFSPPPSASGTQDYMSIWVTGSRDILYVQLEDDVTVVRVDSSTCRALDTFTHQKFSEGSNEDDQIACDALTFGEGAAGVPAGTGTSVLWLRDVTTNDVRAYAIRDGFCPFPTRLRLASQPPVRGGDTVTVCATLSAVTTDVQAPLPRQPLQLTLNGRSLGSAVTDASGRACLATATPPTAGTLPLVATFAGTPAYMPSTATGRLVVESPTAVVAGPPATSSRVPAPFHVAPPNVAPVPAPPPLAVQAPVQAQSQVQTQPQGQPQLQGQPGSMAQRQRQARVALQRTDGGRQEVNLEATRLPATLLAEQATAFVLFGGGLAFWARWRRRAGDLPAPARVRVSGGGGRRRTRRGRRDGGV